MKKLFALLLALAILVPMALTPVAKADDFTVEPFYALNWSKVDTTKYQYIDRLLTTNVSNVGELAKFSYGGKQLIYGQYTPDDVTAMAEVMKTAMDKRPEGMRYWTIYGIAKFMKVSAENALFMDISVNQLKKIYTDILTKYKDIGGQAVMEGVMMQSPADESMAIAVRKRFVSSS